MAKKLTEKGVRVLEFFIVGLALGVIEDIIAIKVATDAPITWHVFKTAFAVALPFAAFSELIVDHPEFWNFLRKTPKFRNGR